MSDISATPLQARWSPFTTFCEGPEDHAKGFALFPAFYGRNYAKWLPKDKTAPILVISSGPGYFQEFLKELGHTDVTGIDTNQAFVDEANERGLNSICASSFDWLPKEGRFAFIFGEQEINHLTRDELMVLLEKCKASLRTGGRLMLNAANAANPLIATEHPGNNWDHYLVTAEGNLRQAFTRAGFAEIQPLPLDFYVLWKNPLNYVAKAVTSTLHLTIKVLFRMYGKDAKIFTKRLAITGTRAR